MRGTLRLRRVEETAEARQVAHLAPPGPFPRGYGEVLRYASPLDGDVALLAAMIDAERGAYVFCRPVD